MIWFQLALFVVSFVLTVLLAPEPNIENARAQVLNPDQFPRATEDAPIPLILGRVRMNAPNTTWWGNFVVEKIEERVKVSLFKKKDVVVGHNYYVDIDLALGMGPEIVMREIYLEDKLHWSGSTNATTPTSISSYDGSAFGGYKKGGGFSINGTFYPGALDLTGNPVDPILEAANGVGQVPGYLGTSHMVVSLWLGESSQLRKLAFVLENYSNDMALSNNGKVGDDMNPAEAIYQIMTHQWRGMGVSADEIDIVALRALGETCLAEGNGVSIVITAETNGKNLLNEILRQVDAVAYQDPDTGLIKFKLIRLDYDPDFLDVYDEDDVVDIKNFSRSGWDEVIAQVKITFPQRDKDSSAVAISQDMATFATIGRLRSTTMAMPFCYDPALANNIASRERAQLSVPLFRLTIEFNRSANKLRPGNVFKLNWPEYGFTELVLRVQEFDLGELLDGKIVAQCLQDSFALNTTVFAEPSDSAWVAPVTSPTDIIVSEAIEVPRVLVNFTAYPVADGIVSPLLFAQRPQTISSSYDVAVSDSALDTNPYYTPQYAPYLGTGTLKVAYDQAEGMALGFDNSVGIEVEQASLTPFVHNATLDDIRNGDKGLLYMNGEWLGFTTAVDNGSGEWTIQNVYRGLLGTTPKTHPIGTRIWEFDGNQVGEGSFDELAEDDTLYYSLMDSVGEKTQTLGDVTEQNLLVNAHIANSPLRPANIKVDGDRNVIIDDSLVDLDVTWVARNRTETSIAIEDDPAETPDQAENYDVDVYVGGVFNAALSSTDETSPYTMPFSTTSITNGDVQIRVKSTRTVGDLRSSVYHGFLNIIMAQVQPTTTFRYWRILCDAAANPSYYGICEIEMRETVGGVDISTTGFAISGGERVGFEDTKAFDNIVSNSDNNSWGVDKTPAIDAWIGQDFGAANDKWIQQITITSRDDSFYNQAPTDFTVQGSPSGLDGTWQTVRAVTAEPAWAQDETRTYELPIVAQYWRLKGTTAGSWSGGALAEIEFYDTISGSNIATGGTASAGSEAFGGTAAQAFDGDKTTSLWAGDTNAVINDLSWVAYDFGSDVEIREFEITARDGADANQTWDGWDLEFSHDGVLWGLAKSYSDVTAWTASESRKYDIE